MKEVMRDKKFLFLFALLTLLTFNFKVLVILRDVLILTAPESKATVLPFIKIWLVLPVSYLLVRLYERLSLRFRRDQIFMIFTGSFLSYLLLFSYVLLPMRDQLIPHGLIVSMKAWLPESLHVVTVLLAYWPFSCFFLVSEMWNIFLLTFLFWGFVSESVTKQEGKKYFGVFSLDIGGLLAGCASLFLNRQISEKSDAGFSGYVDHCVWVLVLTGILQCMMFYFSYRLYGNPIPIAAIKKKKTSDFSLLKQNPMLPYLFFLSFSFEFCDQFLEVVWKSRVLSIYPDSISYSQFMSKFFIVTGCVGIMLTIFFSRLSLRRRSWYFNASITPFLVLFSSVFLFFLIATTQFSPTSYYLELSIFSLATLQASALKMSKYTFFDNTKEMAFLELDSTIKTRARAICDSYSSRLGKTTSSILWQSSLLVAESIAVLGVGALVLCCSLLWIGAVRRLREKVHYELG